MTALQHTNRAAWPCAQLALLPAMRRRLKDFGAHELLLVLAGTSPTHSTQHTHHSIHADAESACESLGIVESLGKRLHRNADVVQVGRSFYYWNIP
jgi:hypothetical protein